MAKANTDRLNELNAAVDRLTHYIAERAKMTALDQEEISGLHGGTALLGDPDEPHAAALLKSDLVRVLDGLRQHQLATADVLSMTPPELVSDDDEELHVVLNDGWATAHSHACSLIRQRIL